MLYFCMFEFYLNKIYFLKKEMTSEALPDYLFQHSNPFPPATVSCHSVLFSLCFITLGKTFFNDLFVFSLSSPLECKFHESKSLVPLLFLVCLKND